MAQLLDSRGPFIAKQEEEQVVVAMNKFLEISDKKGAVRTDGIRLLFLFWR
jgi:hypothetical protein